ncbi:MAG: NAD-dependent epimerase/dehydratase family protein [Fimbriimonadaceae bacterium]|nr:NAD-dependent epimerase/dehydratase family protein [Fimbriimonadaceae bacterium]
MRVIVTAGSGQIGRAVCRGLIAAGHSVVNVDVRGSDVPTDWLPFRTIDLPDWRGDVSDAEALVHLEWSGGVREAIREPARRFSAALTPMAALLEFASSRGMAIVFASSGAVYESPVAEPYVVTEDAPRAEGSAYGVMKRAGEDLVRYFALANNLSAASLRIFNAYGPYGRPTQILSRIAQAMETGEPLRVNGDGEHVRDFVSVEDVASAIVRVLNDSTLRGEAFNIGSGVGISMNALIRFMEQVNGVPCPVEYGPAVVGEARGLVAGIERARERFGWAPSVDLESGIRRLFAG